jgi:hypothetical protein
MSLMKLLTVSRSFVTSPSPLGRYRMVGGRRGLPRFGPAVEPRRPAACPAPLKAAFAGQRELPKLAVDPGTGVPPSPNAGMESPVKPASSPFTKPGAAARTDKGGPAERTGGARKLVSRLRGWLRPKPGRRTRSPFTGKTVRPPVQAHLKLESVRVVRNDLSDSDFEVRGVGATGATPAFEWRSLEKLKRGLGGMSWSQTAARWFEAGRERVQTR